MKGIACVALGMVAYYLWGSSAVFWVVLGCVLI